MRSPQPTGPARPHPGDLFRGSVECEHLRDGLRFHRLPGWARRQCDDPQLATVEAQPSGVRLDVVTRASAVELDLLRTRDGYVGMPLRPDGVVDVVVDGQLVRHETMTGGRTSLRDMATGEVEVTEGPVHTVRVALDGQEHRVEVWLPHNESMLVADVRADAELVPAPRTGIRWVHHGSSISQGSNAATPTGTFVGQTARTLGWDLTNLGLGGSALMDPFVARTIRDLEADLVTLELGINLVNSDLVRRRALGPAVHGWLDTIRDGHPHAPVVLVSPLYCPIHETTPGPGAFDMAAAASGRIAFTATGDPADVAAGRITLEVVREVLAEVVQVRGDEHLLQVDGLALYGPQDAVDHPLPDNLHPDATTHALIAERFVEQLRAAL